MKQKNYLILTSILVIFFLAGFFVVKFPQRPFKLGLDLQGGSHLVYQADLSGIDKEEYSSAMTGLRDIIERRVNLFGVVEPLVQTQMTGEGNFRLIIELAGIKDVSEAIKMIGQTPYLEFREPKPDYDTILEENKELIEKGEMSVDELFQPSSLTGRYLKGAKLNFDNNTYEPLVSLQFDDEGAKIFESLTEKNTGKPLAIYIDNALISAPVVQEKISGGKAQITGVTSEEAKELVTNLNAGALPVPINLISQQTVGPTLGAVSLQKSLKAGMFGFLAIIIFMIIFYRLPGLLASLSLLIYVVLILALFKVIPVTLTLSGIAGFILSMGMAVDANVLIFSRMKEERREKKSFETVIEEGFRRAWPSIRDGNLTTIIAALILFGFGSGFVKGFAFTLALGNLISIFTAVFVTRLLLKSFIGTRFEKWGKLW